MRRCRPLLSFLLGLLFLVQGLAAAAAPLPAVASEAATVMQDAMPPCHAEAMAAEADSAPCCHADCPDMTHCVLSQLLAAAEFSLALRGPVSTPAPRLAQPAFRHPPGSPLRPPITLPV